MSKSCSSKNAFRNIEHRIFILSTNVSIFSSREWFNIEIRLLYVLFYYSVGTSRYSFHWVSIHWDYSTRYESMGLCPVLLLNLFYYFPFLVLAQLSAHHISLYNNMSYSGLSKLPPEVHNQRRIILYIILHIVL